MIIKKTKDYSLIKKSMLDLKDSFYSKTVSSETKIEELAKKFSENAEFFIASQDENILGFISFYCNDFCSKTAYISMIIIDKNYQGKGLGKVLLKTAVDYCKTQEMKCVKLEVACSNKNAIEFYEKFGFVRTEKINDSYYYRIEL